MAVYKRTYRRYEGALTPEWSRFMVPMRFAFEDLYRSRILAMLLLGSAIVPLGSALLIYARHSNTLTLLLNAKQSLLAINETFFMTILGWQSMLCFFVTAFVGPGLVSPDLANNALPLYLSRPFSRTEYVLGKLTVLLTLQSAMTWVPCLLLVALEGYLEGNGWLGANLHIVSGLFLGSWIWMLVLSMLALALSAWVKWKPVAGALLFGVFFVMGGFAEAINGILRTRWGNLLNISHLIGSVWVSLFERPMHRGAGAVFFRVSRGEGIPVWACWLALGAITLACLWLLHRKIRGVEVGVVNPTAVVDNGVMEQTEVGAGRIVFDNVSRFYGEVLGVNRVNLSIPPGVTSLVGPNGSGKSTVMNLMTGLLRPSRGSVRVLDIPTGDPERLFRHVGYCTQVDAFPRGMTGFEFVTSFLLLHGFDAEEARQRAWAAITRVNMTDAAHRQVAAYSKGMRQRIKLAQATAHDPDVLVLDEPLNGLDPMARAETIALFREWAHSGRHVIVSSHILHEVDRISDQVILLSYGYVVAEGQIHGVRSEVTEHPVQVRIRCDRPSLLASRLFAHEHVVEAQVEDSTLLVRTRDADRFHLALNQIVLEEHLQIESVAPSDEDVHSVYQYLIGEGGAA